MNNHRTRTLITIGALAQTRKLARGAALVAGLVVLAVGATALASPIIGVEGTNLAVGAFETIEAKTLSPEWQARIDTKGATDVYVVENKIAPGGTFGWHSHPGPSIVVVKSGELTLYRGDDPDRLPRDVVAGRESFVCAAAGGRALAVLPLRQL